MEVYSVIIAVCEFVNWRNIPDTFRKIEQASVVRMGVGVMSYLYEAQMGQQLMTQRIRG